LSFEMQENECPHKCGNMKNVILKKIIKNEV